MVITEKRLDEIRPYENNPRNNDSAIDATASSIKRFGFKVPIVIDSDGTIVAGHTRYEAAKMLGYEKVPCIIADDLAEDEIKAYRIADNKTSELAKWNYFKLANELASVDIDMSHYGFSPSELESLESLASDLVNISIANEPTPYTPNLTPKVGTQTVDEDDVREAEIEEETKFQTRNEAYNDSMTSVICPHCGREFKVSL